MKFTFLVTIEDKSNIEEYKGATYVEVSKRFENHIQRTLRANIRATTGTDPGSGLRVEALPEPGMEN